MPQSHITTDHHSDGDGGDCKREKGKTVFFSPHWEDLEHNDALHLALKMAAYKAKQVLTLPTTWATEEIPSGRRKKNKNTTNWDQCLPGN